MLKRIHYKWANMNVLFRCNLLQYDQNKLISEGCHRLLFSDHYFYFSLWSGQGPPGQDRGRQRDLRGRGAVDVGDLPSRRREEGILVRRCSGHRETCRHCRPLHHGQEQEGVRTVQRYYVTQREL